MSLPTIFSWPLTIPAISAPGSFPSSSPLAPGAGISTSNPFFLGEGDLLAVLDRVFPEWYLDPIKTFGPGYEIFQSWAKALERTSLAIGRSEASMFVIYSHGGAKALASVEFYRANGVNGAFRLKAGSICRTSRSSRSYALAADVVFNSSSDLVVAGQVRAVAPGFEYNVPGPATTADGTVLPGDIDSLVIPIMEPIFAEPTLQVRQVADAAGGQAAVLDQLGKDRLLPRLPGEADETYKGRIRSLPDTVSPDALKRQLDSIFLVLGLTYDLIETWEARYDTCWDFPNNVDLPSNTMGTSKADCLAFDDTRTDPFRGRWMDEADHMAGLVLVVPEVGAWSERSFAYDDPGTAGPGSEFAFIDTIDMLVSVLTSGTPWNAEFTMRSAGEAGNTQNFSVGFNTGAKLIEVRDGQRWNASTSLWEVNAAFVGVRVRSQAGVDLVAVSEIEAAVSATSGVLYVTEPDGSPGNTINFAALNALNSEGVCQGGLSDDQTALGWRSRSAYDAPDADSFDPSQSYFVRVPFYDGYDLLHNLFYKRLWDLLKQVKGGGTNHVIELRGQ